MATKKRSRKKKIYWQPCTTRHEGNNQHGNHAAVAAFDCAGRQNGRNVASKAHEKGNKRFAVQPHLVHHLIHDESRPRHITRIFHKGDEQIENDDVG